MNTQSKWRLDFARNLCTKLRLPGVQAVMVGGSVARDYSDVYSDLEVILYFEKEPGVEMKHSIMNNLKAEYRYPNIDHGHESALLINGFPVDIWHKTVAFNDEMINKVFLDCSMDLDVSNVLDTIRFGIALYGNEVIHSWKERIKDYPDELTIRFLKTYLPHFHLRNLYYAVHRENPTAIYAMLSAIQSSLFLILLALNKSYFPTYKWMYERLDELPLVPKNIGERLRLMYQISPIEAASELHLILSETLDIIERQYPQLDYAFARYSLDQKPPIAYKSPPFNE